MGTKAHAKAPQLGAVFLGQGFDFCRHVFAGDDAEIFRQAVCEATRGVFETFGFFKFQQRFNGGGDRAVHEFLQALAHVFAKTGNEQIVRDDFNLRFEARIATMQFSNGLALPHNVALAGQTKFGVCRCRQAYGAGSDFGGQGLHGRLFQQLGLAAVQGFARNKAQAHDTTYDFAFDRDGAIFFYTRH